MKADAMAEMLDPNGDVDALLDQLFEFADANCWRENFGEIDRLLTIVDPVQLGPDLTVGVAVVSNWCREFLPSRPGFMERAREMFADDIRELEGL